jgi:hypothetical protein
VARKKAGSRPRNGAGERGTPRRKSKPGADRPGGPAQLPRIETPRGMSPEQVAHTRELFWQNVIREILTSLSTVSAMRPSGAPRPQTLVENAPQAADDGEVAGPAAEQIVARSGTEMEPHHSQYQPELFDGRLAVILKNGERVPIADVFPVFGCGMSEPGQRALSLAVECSVFQIRTPQGQVFTLPLHEIRGFHALTPELIKRIAEASRAKHRRAEVPEAMPFGFAAFTSLSQGRDVMVPEAPGHPME